MNPRCLYLFPAALIAIAACSSSPDLSHIHLGADGGDAGDGPAVGGDGPDGAVDAVMMNCGDPSEPVDPTALIDDMESGSDPAIPTGNGRNGSWWAGGDALSPNAKIIPNGLAPAVEIPGGRCGSAHAMRVSGQGFTSWAVLSVSMRYGADGDGGMGLLPYDAHYRTGVTFWARIGDTSATAVRFAVSDGNTRPEGGVCDATVSSGPTACYDLFGADLSANLTNKTWTQFRIPFLGLTQRNFGLQQPALDTSAIYTIEFDFNPGEIFDLWVDDIAFY